MKRESMMQGAVLTKNQFLFWLIVEYLRMYEESLCQHMFGISSSLLQAFSTSPYR